MPAEFQMETPTRESAGAPPPNASDPTPPDTGADGLPSSPPSYYGHRLWQVDGDEQAPEEGAQPSAEPKTEPQPAPAQSAPPSADLEGRLKDYEAKVETLERRLRDTHTWGNQANVVAQAAQALEAARAQHDYVQRQLAAQREAEKFPVSVSPDDLLTDGKHILSSMEQAATWARDVALGRVSPYISALQAQVQQMEALRPLAEDYARSKAHGRLTKAGLDAEQADKLLDRAFGEVINQDQQHSAQYRVNPDAIEWAAKFLMDRDGAPIKATPQPTPTAGKGDERPQRRQAHGLTSEGARAAAKVQQLFKIKFKPEQLGELARMNGRI